MATRKSAVPAGASPKAAEAAHDLGPAAVPARRRAAKAVPPLPADPAAAGAAPPKHKLVRDSFTMPKNEYALFAELKQRALQSARTVKKSEILRAGIGALSRMSDRSLWAALDAVPSLKAGRPKRDVAVASMPAAKKR